MTKTTIVRRTAERIREIRKSKKISQEQLAEKAGLHPTLIGKMERAEINPTIVSLEKIAKAFNISLSELFSFASEKKTVDADVLVIDEAVEILEHALEKAKKIRSLKQNR